MRFARDGHGFSIRPNSRNESLSESLAETNQARKRFTFPRRQHNFHSLPLAAARLQIAKRYRIIAFLQSHNFIYKLRGILNAQACECCSAKRTAGSAYAGNGSGGYHIYGGRRISATETIGAGGLANTDGHDPPGEAHR